MRPLVFAAPVAILVLWVVFAGPSRRTLGVVSLGLLLAPVYLLALLLTPLGLHLTVVEPLARSLDDDGALFGFLVGLLTYGVSVLYALFFASWLLRRLDRTPSGNAQE